MRIIPVPDKAPMKQLETAGQNALITQRQKQSTIENKVEHGG